jgi:hypothetical protein
LKLELQAPKERVTKYKVNNFYFTDKKVVAAMTEVWRNLPAHMKFFRKMHRLIKWYRGYCTTAAKKRKAEEATLHHRLEVAHHQL